VTLVHPFITSAKLTQLPRKTLCNASFEFELFTVLEDDRSPRDCLKIYVTGFALFKPATFYLPTLMGVSKLRSALVATLINTSPED
jgi:hypothetical protein